MFLKSEGKLSLGVRLRGCVETGDKRKTLSKNPSQTANTSKHELTSVWSGSLPPVKNARPLALYPEHLSVSNLEG